jgi:hypothetical protein
MQYSRFSDFPIFRFTVYGFADLPICRFADLQTRLFAASWVYQIIRFVGEILQIIRFGVIRHPQNSVKAR